MPGWHGTPFNKGPVDARVYAGAFIVHGRDYDDTDLPLVLTATAAGNR
jgi:hypothetical protein